MDRRRPPRWQRLLKRASIASAAVLMGAVVGGYFVQRQRDATFRAKHPAPGTLVDIGGHRLHWRLSGAGDFTFVLEPGLGDYSAAWRELEASFGELGRVLVYDRAGLGWSEEGPYPRSPSQLADELHRLLEASGVPPPYIFVGHSLGGLVETIYATRHPERVGGLFLIDPTHRDQVRKFPAFPALPMMIATQLPRAASIGLPQLTMKGADPVIRQAKHVRTAGAEMRGFLREAQSDEPFALDLDAIPIFVLTAGEYAGLPFESEEKKRAVWETWRSLHAELVAASSSSIREHRIIGGASHYIHRDQPGAVREAVREFVDRLRAERQGK